VSVEYKHDGVVSSDVCVVTVLKNEEQIEIPRAFIEGWGDGFLLIRGKYAAKKKGIVDMAEKPSVGRKACMDAMCHQCEHFNLLGRKDCGRPNCPLYTYMPFAELKPDTSWADLKTGSAIGFVGKKGLSTEDTLKAAKAVVAFRYWGDLPKEVETALSELEGAAGGGSDGTEVPY
jgi:hypothetical protein